MKVNPEAGTGSFEELPKKTKFRQSVKFDFENEQECYDEIRTQMRQIGISGQVIMTPIMKVSVVRFNEILRIARKDYLSLLLNPHGLNGGI